MSNDKCAWTPMGFEHPGAFETGCEQAFEMMTEGSPEDHGFAFCPFCGGEIDEQPTPE